MDLKINLNDLGNDINIHIHFVSIPVKFKVFHENVYKI